MLEPARTTAKRRFQRGSKRTITFDIRRKTNVSAEPELWDALKEIAEEQRKSLSQIISDINCTHSGIGLSTAIRIFVLQEIRKRQASRHEESMQ